MSNTQVAIHILVSGRVQGVCFRMHTQKEATRLGLSGWVRNLPNGQVEVVAEGPKDGVEELLEWCRHGPAHALVDGTEHDWSKSNALYSDFRIRTTP